MLEQHEHNPTKGGHEVSSIPIIMPKDGMVLCQKEHDLNAYPQLFL